MVVVMTEEVLLAVNDLTKIFNVGNIFRRKTITAVDSVSFEIPPKKVVALVGESGSGKTTISRMILLLEKPTSGEILYEGKQNIFEMPKEKRFEYKKNVQAVFQDPYSSFNHFYKSKHWLDITVNKLKLASSENEKQKKISEALDSVGLGPEVLNKYPHQLSGGQMQRIMIARAFLANPKLLVADEPVTMLDPSIKAGILQVILDSKESSGMSVLFITHDLSMAYYLTDEIIILYSGSIVESGDARTLIDNPTHPYTQQLISSIPTPDPKKRWKTRIYLTTKGLTRALGTIETKGCKFLDKCPNATERCEKEKPCFIEVEKNHWVRCHRYP